MSLYQQMSNLDSPCLPFRSTEFGKPMVDALMSGSIKRPLNELSCRSQ
jgi:hypothetical protein